MLRWMTPTILTMSCQVATTLALLLFSTLARAQAIPETLGWFQIPDTNLRSVCPPNNFNNSGYNFFDVCNGVTDAWNGGVFDTSRNRLIIWGGGHADYFGNEIYALDLDDLTIQRLNNPSLNWPTSCTGNGTMPDGAPTSRHTYNQLAYIEHMDRMFVFGGSNVPCGNLLGDTWTLDLATIQWQRMDPAGQGPTSNFGRVSDYDPNTQKVYIRDDFYLYSYTYETNTYQRLSGAVGMSDWKDGVIDPNRQLFLIRVNGQMFSYDISPDSTYTLQPFDTTGGEAIVSSQWSGLAYDPVSDRIVAWNGSDTVYSLNVDTRVWTPITYLNGPGSALSNGTLGRWRYSPASGVFVVVNSADNNAYTFRLTPSNGGSNLVPNAPTTLLIQ